MINPIATLEKVREWLTRDDFFHYTYLEEDGLYKDHQRILRLVNATLDPASGPS